MYSPVGENATDIGIFQNEIQSIKLAVNRSQTFKDLSIDDEIIHLESCEKHILVMVFEAALSKFLIFFNVKISYIIILSFDVVNANKLNPLTIRFDKAGDSSI